MRVSCSTGNRNAETHKYFDVPTLLRTHSCEPIPQDTISNSTFAMPSDGLAILRKASSYKFSRFGLQLGQLSVICFR